MALVLTLRAGEDMFVDHDQFTLSRIVDESNVRFVRERDQAVFDVSTEEKTEIDEDVLVQLGDRITTKSVRIAIDAPRSKMLLTGVKYRASPPPPKGR